MTSPKTRPFLAILIAIIAVIAGAALKLTDTGADQFMSHAHCYLFNTHLMILHGGSDFLIGIAYVMISGTLTFLVLRTRQDLPFHWMMPKRLFVTIPPSFENWILVQPGARLPKEYGGARLVQRDQFSQEFDFFVDQMADSSMLKLMTGSELDSIAAHLEEASSQNKILWKQRLSVRISGLSTHAEALVPCEVPLAIPGLASDVRFAPPSEEKSATPSVGRNSPLRTSGVKATRCAKCRSELTPKEVSYCRFNFAKMGRQYLCQKCQ